MSDSDLFANGINFDARATFRKWPSLNGQRRIDSSGPHLLMDGTLDACFREFLGAACRATPLRDLYVATATIG